MTTNETPASTPALRVSLLIAEPPRGPEIAAIHARTFKDAWSGDAMTGLLSDPGAVAFIALTAGAAAPIGFVIARMVGDEAEILSIGVLPEYQRRGVGGQLVGAVTRALQRADAKRLFLEVAVDNEAARTLYDKQGFHAVGLRRAYYQRPGKEPVDGLTLSRSLDAPK